MISSTYIFFGRSGCGKGTQAKLLIDKLKTLEPNKPLVHIETGKLFRDFVEKSDSFTSLRTKEVLNEGNFLPPFLPVWIWTDYLVKNITEESFLILDGLARKENEAPILDSAIKFYKREKPVVILIDVSRDWSKERLLARGRNDDTEERIKNRLDAFDNDAVPAIAFFRDNKEYSFISVNGEQSIEEVNNEIFTKIGLNNDLH